MKNISGLLKKISILIIGIIIGMCTSLIIKNKVVKPQNEKVDKFRGYYYMLNQWLIIKQQGNNLVEYFESNNYNTIAIYGMGEMGNRLYDELKDTAVEIKYAIDKNQDNTCSELKIYTLEDEYEEVDAIIVTAVFAFDDIVKELKNKSTGKIISLEDVILEFDSLA